MEGIYFDNNATTRVDEKVVEAMLPYFTEQFGNPSSMHSFGNKVGLAIKKARMQVQELLGAEHDSEIIFTSCGTESDSTAILSALRAQPERKEVITTVVEHPAVLTLCAWLEKEGYKVHYLKVDGKGRVDMDEYKKLLTDQTAIVSVMWANNETGTFFPVVQMAELAHAAGAMFHTDAVQAVGKVPIDLKSTKIDMLSLSGHKLHGPKGIGALYVRKGTKFNSLLKGGNQERGRRGGTENVPGIVGLGAAARLAQAHLDDERTRVKALRDRLEAGILQQVVGCVVNGDTDNRLPNTLNLAFEGLEGEAVQTHLNRVGIAVSLGSACASGSMDPSHVLLAMNVPRQTINGALRFSLSRFNDEADIDKVVEALPPIVDKLR